MNVAQHMRAWLSLCLSCWVGWTWEGTGDSSSAYIAFADTDTRHEMGVLVINTTLQQLKWLCDAGNSGLQCHCFTATRMKFACAVGDRQRSPGVTLYVRRNESQVKGAVQQIKPMEPQSLKRPAARAADRPLSTSCREVRSDSSFVGAC